MLDEYWSPHNYLDTMVLEKSNEQKTQKQRYPRLPQSISTVHYQTINQKMTAQKRKMYVNDVLRS